MVRDYDSTLLTILLPAFACFSCSAELFSHVAGELSGVSMLPTIFPGSSLTLCHLVACTLFVLLGSSKAYSPTSPVSCEFSIIFSNLVLLSNLVLIFDLHVLACPLLFRRLTRLRLQCV